MSDEQTPEVTPEAPEVTPEAPADELPTTAKPKRSRSRSGTRSRAKSSGDAPKRARPSGGSRGTRSKKIDIGKGMADLYASVGVGLTVIPSKPSPLGRPANQLVGMTIVEQASELGAAWAKLADENPAVREVLERVVTTGAAAAIITAHMPVLAIAGLAYGFVPDSMAPLVMAAMGMSGGEQPQQPQQPEQAAA